jgi:hypothetical protein
VDRGTHIDIEVATKTSSGWKLAVAAKPAGCNGCPAPGPVGVVMPGGTLQVIYADPAAKAVRSATLQGSSWVEGDVESGVSGFGLSAATAGDKAYAAYYTGAGGVDVATWAGSAWSAAPAATAPDPDTNATGNEAARTAVGATDDGTVYLAWDDKDAGVRLASGQGSFAPVQTQGTAGGAHPAITVSGSGVFLSWYAVQNQNLTRARRSPRASRRRGRRTVGRTRRSRSPRSPRAPSSR